MSEQDQIARLEFEVGLHEKRRKEAEDKLRVAELQHQSALKQVKTATTKEISKVKSSSASTLLEINSFIQAFTVEAPSGDRAERILLNRIMVLLWDKVKKFDPKMYDIIMKDEEGNLRTEDMIYTFEDINNLRHKIFEAVTNDRKNFSKTDQASMAKQLLGPLILGQEV